MARDSHQGAAYRWRDGPEDEEPEERQIAVDPFSLRQFSRSRFNIDSPLPIPAVSVDHHLPAPAREAPLSSATVPCPAERRDAHLAVEHPTMPGRFSSSAGRQMELELSLADFVDEFDADVLPSPGERRPSAPQRWGSDVPLIAGDSRGGSNDGRRNRKAIGHASGGVGAPFSCCLYLPGLTRRPGGKPPQAAPAARAWSSPPVPETLRRSAAAAAEPDQTTVRQSTMSLAVSLDLERFDCASSLSSSSASDLALDGAGEASSSFIDLPLELILGCDGDEADLPVHAAFMF